MNTQRLLVTGERTDAPSGGDPGPVERLPDWLVPLWGLLGVLVGGTVRGPKRRPGRHAKRHPYATDIFERFIQHILDQVANDSLSEESALETGYF